MRRVMLYVPEDVVSSFDDYVRKVEEAKAQGPAAVRQLETGRANPTLDTLLRIANALDARVCLR